MNTFILRWNPNISSYKMETHLEVVAHAKKMEFPQSFDWSVFEWQKVKDGSKAHYVYIEIFDAYITTEFKELLAENFENEFDKIKWHKGHSGELLDKATADRLFKKLIPIIHRSGHKQADMIEDFIENGWHKGYLD